MVESGCGNGEYRDALREGQGDPVPVAPLYWLALQPPKPTSRC